MTCGHCARRVEHAARALPGVESVEVDLEGGRARVRGTASAQAVIEAIEQAGYPASLVAATVPAPALEAKTVPVATTGESVKLSCQ